MTFVINMMEHIIIHTSWQVCLAVIGQAGADARKSMDRILSAAAAAATARVLPVGCFDRRGDAILQLSAAEEASTSEELVINAALQCPLRCFDTAAEAVKACAVGAVRLRCADKAPLLTLREFGQGPMATLQSRGSDPLVHRDVSAGLGADELGIFPLTMPIALVAHTASTAGGAHLLGYFRTLRHGVALGRMTAAYAALPSTTSTDITVYCPEGAAAHVVAGIRSHPSAAVRDIAAAAAEGSIAAPLACMELTIDSRIQKVRVCALPHTAAGDALPLSEFRALLASSAACLVTGDSSLNEAICADRVFQYSCEPHKVDVEKSLKAMVGSKDSSDWSEIISALWRFTSARSDAEAAKSWSALCAALPATTDRWAAVRSAFASYTGEIRRQHAHLGSRTVEALVAMAGANA